MQPIQPVIKGRGASHNPPNRFEKMHLELVTDERTDDEPPPAPETEYFRDSSRSIIVSNDSPDVFFDKSINVYRGCVHGCIYCYARPYHEYLGLSAGIDFETKIFVKEDAPRLLRSELSSPKWQPQVLAISGVTDAYQPIERRLQLTRRCLEVLAEFRNPVSLVTKNHLITRDIDLLAPMAAFDGVSVHIGVTSLDPELANVMEPRASAPHARLAAIRELSAAGVPTSVLIAPVIPGLTDHEIPAILEAAREAGACHANYTMLRLPHGIKELFSTWLEQRFPTKKDKVLGRIRDMRGGELNDPSFGSRMKGAGPIAEMIRQVFQTNV
ncbi:MAG: PA0069 family radical SAM protein, partial [Planctomycetota bacterium]